MAGGKWLRWGETLSSRVGKELTWLDGVSPHPHESFLFPANPRCPDALATVRVKNFALKFSPGLPLCITMNTRTIIQRMFSKKAAVAVGVLVCFSFSDLNAANHPDTAGWKNLFAADLSDGVNGEHWKWEGGTLVANDHETLWSKESYGNFMLDLEFKVAKEANSGVFLRSGDIKNVLAALEIQVHESADGSRYGMVGAIYDAMPPSKSMAKPVGEWNHFTITCKDSLVSVVFNGEEVIHADLNNWTEVRKNPDGTPNKFPKALKDSARKGPLGLQGLHGKAQAPVWYRNLKIKILE